MIGERTNANGSKAFREAMLAEDWETLRRHRQGPARDGAHMLDLCVDYVGRDGVADMTRAGQPARHCVDAADHARLHRARVLEAGLELLGGRCVDQLGQLRGRRRPGFPVRTSCELVAEHGAAVVALTIDEEGQARTAEKKVGSPSG